MYNRNSPSKQKKKRYQYSLIGLFVIGLFFWVSLFCATIHVAHLPSFSIRRVRDKVSRLELLEGQMELEITKQNRIGREQILNFSISILNTLEDIVNHTPAKYIPPQHWNHFPDIWIVGLAKAGTSQLYQILTHHPEMQAFHDNKEFCMDNKRMLNYSLPNEQLYASLYSFHDFMNNNMSRSISTKKNRTINACLNLKETLLHYMYIQKYYYNASSYLDHKKIIIIIRDPADLLFSIFNFFSIPEMDVIGDRTEKTWSSESLDYRSPELFHEFILSGNKSVSGRRLLFDLRQWIVTSLTWMYLAGRENVLVIKNEDMVPEEVTRQGGLLDQLSNFLHVDRDSFDPQIFKSKTNCNDGNMSSRGADRKCMSNAKNKSSSLITYRNRTMLPKTRHIIYVLVSEGCKMMAEQFNHVMYEGCIQRLIDL